MFLSIARFSVQSVVLTVTASGSFIEIINGSESNIYFFAASYSPLKSDIVKERKAVAVFLDICMLGTEKASVANTGPPNTIFCSDKPNTILCQAKLLPVALLLRKLCQMWWNFQIFTVLELREKK